MNQTRAGLVAVVVIGLVAALIVAWVTDEPSAAPVREECVLGGERPCSTNVEERKAYAFQVAHCGLIHVVDFDGSYWDVDKASMTEDENQRFGINSDQGTMTLERANLAVYRSERGGEATLRRHVGPPNFFNCA